MVIANILKNKGGNILSVLPHAPVADVVQVLASHRIGAVLVVSGSGLLMGILSERDVVRSLAENGAGTLDRTASDLMTADVTTATPQTSVAAAMEMMTAGRFRHVPILEDGRLIGLVSIGDVVKAKIAASDDEVDSLRAYVAGGV